MKKSNTNMANTYADLFEYESFHVFCTVEYMKVKLLKDMCGKKAGTEIDKIILNPANGAFTIPKTKKKAVVPSKKPLGAEFKGVHTRFEDSDEDFVYIPNKVKSSTFKFYEGRKKVRLMTYELFEEIEKFMNEMGRSVITYDDEGLVRVAGVDLEPLFDLKTRYTLPSGKYSFVRVY